MPQQQLPQACTLPSPSTCLPAVIIVQPDGQTVLAEEVILLLPGAEGVGGSSGGNGGSEGKGAQPLPEPAPRHDLHRSVSQSGWWRWQAASRSGDADVEAQQQAEAQPPQGPDEPQQHGSR